MERWWNEQQAQQRLNTEKDLHEEESRLQHTADNEAIQKCMELTHMKKREEDLKNLKEQRSRGAELLKGDEKKIPKQNDVVLMRKETPQRKQEEHIKEESKEHGKEEDQLERKEDQPMKLKEHSEEQGKEEDQPVKLKEHSEEQGKEEDQQERKEDQPMKLKEHSEEQGKEEDQQERKEDQPVKQGKEIKEHSEEQGKEEDQLERKEDQPMKLKEHGEEQGKEEDQQERKEDQPVKQGKEIKEHSEEQGKEEDQPIKQEEQIKEYSEEQRKEDQQEKKDQPIKQVEQIKEHSEEQGKGKDQLERKEDQPMKQEQQIKEHSEEQGKEENQLARKKDQPMKQKEQIKELSEEQGKEDQQERKDDQPMKQDKKIKEHSEEQGNKENQPNGEKVRLKSENENQIKRKDELNELEKTLKNREDQLNKWNENLCKQQNDLTSRSKVLKRREERREIQLETINRQEDEINSQKRMIEQLTKIIEEKNEEMKKDEERMKEQVLQMERNCETLNTQEEKLQTLKTEVQNMKKQKQREKQQTLREKQWIEEEINTLQIQRTEKENEKENLQKQNIANKEEIHRQQIETLRNGEDIKAQTDLIQKLKEEVETQTAAFHKLKEETKEQTALIQKLKEEMNECEETLQKQKNMKQIHEREVEQQKSQIQEQKIIINTQKEELDIQKREIQTNARTIKQTRRKKQTLEKKIQTVEKQQQIKNEKFQKEVTELERLKKLYKEDVSLMRSEAEQNKYREIRRREEDLQTLQDFYDQLNNRLSSLSYKQDFGTEGVLSVELGKIFEKMKMELQRSSEEIEILKKTLKQTERREKQASSQKDKQDDASQDAASTVDKVFEEIIFSENLEDSEGITKSTLKSVTDILLSLGLDDFYPNKLTIESVLSIGSPKEKQTNSNVAFIYLQKLLMLNYRVRCITEENENQETLDSKNAKKKEEIHPMDVQMAVFYCADSFLRQIMVTKLSSCQYALPLLVPSPTSTDIELPLWTFRQIKKTWKSVGGLSTSLPVCQVKAPMVFFCRLGSVSTSKSQLLNSVINPTYDTFFHRDSPGSSRNRLFMEGLVEIAWYCPAGNTDDLFSDITAFCNLHGDGLDYKKQTDFLAEGATVNVVLMQNMKPDDKRREFLHMLHKSSKPLICLVSDLQKGSRQIGHGLNIKIGLRGRNRDDLKKELVGAIKFCLQKCNFRHTFSLDKSSKVAKRSGFRVDEDRYCIEGKARAQKVIKILEGEKCSEIKVKFLPCQGNLWNDWARKNKELHRLHGKMQQHNRDVTLTEMKEIRTKQRGINLKFLKSFVTHLSNSTNQTRYFLQWIRYVIDDKFSNQLSQIHMKYNNKWLEVQKLKNSQGKSEELKVIQKQLEEVSEELDTVTLGLEHIVREMGQIYEAWAECPDKMTAEVSALPALAADLLISGHPLELMDGDAAHVPLTWIESVLDKVTEMLGDQRVFVLSVLGLQSSGKSTMLNTMFGLQFAVSAGRCTRGAFMQLVRVKEEAKEELKFDYLLVVDTEGLQSLELAGKSKINHDNELATFVVCLANMTLINIFGENPAEIQEILQIVIQAILRMKNDKLKPRCMFVHQNITDLTAAEKNIEGRRRLQEKLNEITLSVAKEEGCNAECFTDVIRFNIQTDVHYFAQLWEGNPPMAPPNPRYSKSAERLKQAIYKAAAQEKVVRLSELKVHIKELWNAVVNEDFVFSFKNSLDIALYQKTISDKH